MTDTETIEKARLALAEEFEIDVESIQPEALLKDTLRLDSLDLVDMVVLVHEYFGFTMSKDEFAGILTFQDFYDYLIGRLDKEAALKGA